MLDFGILGMNARNLLYIKKFNPKKAIRLADNKIKTKIFLSERGIPVPQTYGIIKSRKELFDFDFSSIPNQDFVIKPNKGSKGQGVHIVHLLSEENKLQYGLQGGKDIKDSYFSKLKGKIDSRMEFVKDSDIYKFFHDRFIGTHISHDNYYKVGGEVINDLDFKILLSEILDGRYSLTFGEDKILIEEKLVPSEDFSRFCKYGLADIRVIVFNLVPIAAMLRVPTDSSGGKANLAQGGIGFGVEVGSGKIKSMFQSRKIYTKDFIGGYNDVVNRKLQYWNDILLYSSRIQYFVNIGYLALDWVITNEGPKLLEINARAGLEVQNASILPLQKRLQKVQDMKISDPEKGIEIAKSLFNSSKSSIISMAKVVYLSQVGRLRVERPYDAKDIVVKVDMATDKNYISKYLYEMIKDVSSDVLIDLYESEIVFKNVRFIVKDSLEADVIILGRNLLSEYYIKPINKINTSFSVISKTNLVDDEKETLHLVDQKLDSIGKLLNLSNILKPSNINDELDNFITWHGNYNPKFTYNFPSQGVLKNIILDLDSLNDKYFRSDFGLKSKFGGIFIDKINEIKLKTNLLSAYQNKSYEQIFELNEKLFGNYDQGLLHESKDKLFMQKHNDGVDRGEILSQAKIKEITRKYLDEKGIVGVKIIFDSNTLARVAVSRGKNLEVKFSTTAIFHEKELNATLAHEIDVHLMRHLNGQKSGWKILKSGTGFYLGSEEGLAVYKSFDYLPSGFEKLGMFERYYLVNEGMYSDFARLAEIIRGIKKCSLIDSFKYALRVKRGVQDTGFIDKGAIYMKDCVYLSGYHDIEKFVKGGGDLDKLMIGKIKISDIDFIY